MRLECIRFSVILLLSAACSHTLFGGEGPPIDRPLVADAIRQSMQDRAYQKAIEAIDGALKAEGAPADYLAYLKGRALYLDGRYDEAIRWLEGFSERFPASRWARQARFAKALALARKGDFRSAELLYRQEAEWLLSADRRQQLAAIYLEFADRHFEPPEEEKKPDYRKALEFYQQALEVGPKPEEAARIELRIARCYQELGKLNDAAEHYRRFLDDHPDSPLAMEASYRLGECQLKLSHFKEARRVWQDLLARYADDQSEWVAQATFHLAHTWRAPKPTSDHELNLGVAALERFLERFPAHRLAGPAHLEIARSYMHRGRYGEAAAGLARFLEAPPESAGQEVPEAANLLGQAYQLQKEYTEALAAWRQYLAEHPAHHAWSAVQQQIVETEFLMGLEEFRATRYEKARRLWSDFLARHPLDPRNPEILYRLGEMNFRQEKWKEAIADWQRLVSKYPKSEPASQAQFMIGRTLDEKLGQPAEALEAYRKLDWGRYAPQARRAVAQLTAKAFSVATERVFRSDETPAVKLTSRNVEKLNVRVYWLNLETYFRKMHLAGGVERLDIALIDPNRSFEFAVPEYAAYQELANTIPVPLPEGAKAGVAAVTVATDTLEATTMVIQSDLDIIVKSSRDEVFVFAENMRTGKPWPGVRLLISDGKTVFAEGATGRDGVFQRAFKELKNTDDVRVLAVAGGHVASNVVGLQGVGVSRGLSDKGYIYTDRPAYRAGQLVHIRGCIRHVAGSPGQPGTPRDSAPVIDDLAPDGPGPAAAERPATDVYLIQEGKRYQLDVFDSRNRSVWHQEVTLGPFGTFHTHLLLPPASPRGTYRIVVQNKAGKSFSGTFRVLEYKLEPIRLVVDTPRRVYYRGETIEGTIRAEFYYGAPLARRPIRYQLADDRVHTATTDDEGEVRFKLPTREFAESQVLPFRVSLPERNVETEVNFLLAVEGYSVQVSTVREVFIAGETFEVTVETHDAEGKPASRKLALEVLEKTEVEGKVGERLVETHTIQTGEKDGQGRLTIKIEKGGRYALRAEGTDRFGNPVSGERLVQISGQDDQVRLRILADRHTFRVGEKADVRLHWRGGPALGLVTYQGARVLDYQLIQLRTGANRLSIPVTPALAPNFELAVAVMSDHGGGDSDGLPKHRFHTASSPFTVRRPLKLKLALRGVEDPERTPRPGDEVEVTVTATDPQGRPVEAEVSLALVERSLLDRFQWPLPAIDEFFRGQPRRPAVRTTSSITFAYRPATRLSDPLLLAERDRRKTAEAEMEALEAVTRFSLGLAAPMSGEKADRDRPEASGLRNQRGMMGGYAAGVGGRGPSEAAAEEEGEEQGAVQEQKPRRRLAGGRASRREVAGGGVHMGFPRPAAPGEPTDGKRAWGTTGKGYPVADLIMPPRSSLELFGRPVAAIQADGTFGHLLVIRGKVDADQLREGIERLRRAGTVLLPELGPQETGYWNPAVVTGRDGKATARFRLPERSTAWKLVAKGITRDTLAGEAETELTVAKPLFGQLTLPPAFTDGDQADVRVTVHNDLIDKGTIQVTLATVISGRRVEETKPIKVDGKGIYELSFTRRIERPKPGESQSEGRGGVRRVQFELRVSAQRPDGTEEIDLVRRSVPLQPFGIRVFRTAGGSATSDTTTWVEAPSRMPLQNPSLQILVGPTVERSLLDIVLGPALACPLDVGRIASSLDSATGDLMASLALQKLVSASREAGGPHAGDLDGRVRSALGLLAAAQNDDGGWSWTGRAGRSNRYATARVVWALSLAREAGYAVPDKAFDKALSYLRGQVAAVPHDDYLTQAVLLHALAAAGRGDFALANRLYRVRQSLEPAALAYLSLAFLEMERRATAEELLQLLATRPLDPPAESTARRLNRVPWAGGGLELRALYALALQQVVPESPEAKELVDWLLAHRTGHRWVPDRATGPAALALCLWFQQSRFEGERYSLAVFVNDVQVQVLQIDRRSTTRTIQVPDKLLVEGRQRINFQMTGRGRYTYQCILEGFVPADESAGTTKAWEVKRTYEPAPLEVEGRPVPRGFGLVQGSYRTFRNRLTQLPVGRRGVVEIQLQRQGIAVDTPESQLEYLVVTDPIPAGAAVVEGSVKGGFERFEIGPGAITFYVGSRRFIQPIRYELRGYLAGQYRAGPTQVRDAYRPDMLAVCQPQELAVLPEGAKSGDPYRLTPQELYDLGKHAFERDDFQAAAKHLTQLVENWNLKPDVYRDVVTRLLDVHLKLGPPAKVVEYFEIIKEKWPTQEIPFDKIVQVGAAYHEMGEYERSYLIFRATIENRFGRESRVAGFLQAQGEFLRSVQVMEDLLAQYPPEPYVAAAHYALAQRVYAKAPEASADPRLREAGVTRVHLLHRAWAMLENFLTAHPDDPAADQASFAAANALLDLKAYAQAAEACNRYAARYPKSRLLDSFWYMIGYCHFARGQHQQALQMCRRVAEAEHVDPATGRRAESPNKWQAIYILGQIHHSLGQAAQAIQYYRRVQDRFADAREAIQYFLRKQISLPEVTTVAPGRPVELELRFRNIASCEVKVYRIDLMKFSLLRRQLETITEINLAGIDPYHETALTLGDGLDYRDRTHRLALPLEDEGAYLVVCRGDSLHTSGLVLVSPLAVEVQEDVASGRVRTTVRDTAKNRYVGDVHVKVIGSRNEQFVSGSSDLRGVFIADGIRGKATVIALKEPAQYAFYRGQAELLPTVPQPEKAKAAAAKARPAPAAGRTLEEQLLRGLRTTNSALQGRQVEQLEQLYESAEEGVPAEEAF